MYTVLGGPGGHVRAMLGNASDPNTKKVRFLFFFQGPLYILFWGPGGQVGATFGNCHGHKNEKTPLSKAYFPFLAFPMQDGLLHALFAHDVLVRWSLPGTENHLYVFWVVLDF